MQNNERNLAAQLALESSEDFMICIEELDAENALIEEQGYKGRKIYRKPLLNLAWTLDIP